MERKRKRTLKRKEAKGISIPVWMNNGLEGYQVSWYAKMPLVLFHCINSPLRAFQEVRELNTISLYLSQLYRKVLLCARGSKFNSLPFSFNYFLLIITNFLG